MALTDIPWFPILLAAYMGFSGFRKGSLSLDGGIAAFIIGSIMLSVPLRTFGVSLIVFYLVGSKATKVGKELKSQFEEGHQEAGNRNAAQVLCNSFSAFLATLFWSATFAPGSIFSPLLGPSLPGPPYDSTKWCAVSSFSGDAWSRRAVYFALGHFACCLGDTLASELGILSKNPPRLITTLKVVPPGTNGGVSRTGTLASVAGGIIMGATFAATLFIESSACRSEWRSVVPLVFWGAFGGLFGSLVDSLMGATVQRTRFSAKTKRILIDESPVPINVSDIQVISGIDLLSNNQVNLISSIVIAALCGFLS